MVAISDGHHFVIPVSIDELLSIIGSCRTSYYHKKIVGPYELSPLNMNTKAWRSMQYILKLWKPSTGHNVELTEKE